MCLQQSHPVNKVSCKALYGGLCLHVGMAGRWDAHTSAHVALRILCPCLQTVLLADPSARRYLLQVAGLAAQMVQHLLTVIRGRQQTLSVSTAAVSAAACPASLPAE